MCLMPLIIGCTKEIQIHETNGELIMVPSLEKIYPFIPHHIDNAVLLRYTTGPCTWRQILQWLRFANSSKRITQYVFNELDNSERCLSIVLYPVLHVLDKLRLKDGLAIFIRQGRPRPRAHQPSKSAPHPLALGQARQANARRWPASAVDAPFR